MSLCKPRSAGPSTQAAGFSQTIDDYHHPYRDTVVRRSSGRLPQSAPGAIGRWQFERAGQKGLLLRPVRYSGSEGEAWPQHDLGGVPLPHGKAEYEAYPRGRRGGSWRAAARTDDSRATLALVPACPGAQVAESGCHAGNDGGRVRENATLWLPRWHDGKIASATGQDGRTWRRSVLARHSGRRLRLRWHRFADLAHRAFDCATACPAPRIFGHDRPRHLPPGVSFRRRAVHDPVSETLTNGTRCSSGRLVHGLSRKRSRSGVDSTRRAGWWSHVQGLPDRPVFATGPYQRT